MSWMDIIHKAKTIRQETASKTGNRLVPTDLLTNLPSQILPQLDKERERTMRTNEQLRANLDARMKQINSQIKSKQLEIDNEKRGQNNQLKLNRLGKDMNILREKASKIKRQVMIDSGKKQRLAGKLARDGGLSQNVKGILQNQGTKTPVQSVRDAEPIESVALPSVEGTTPTQDPLVGFAQERGLMPKTTQNVPKPMDNVPKPMDNVPINKPPSNLLPRDAQGNVIPAKTPTKPIENVKLPDVPKETQQVTQEATQQASQPTPQQKQITGPPPKRMTTAQLNEQARQKRQQQSNNPPDPPKDAQGNPIPPKEIPGVNQQLIQQNRRMQDKFLQDMQRTVERSAKSGRQRRKDAKAQAKRQKQQVRQQKTQQRLAEQQRRQQQKEAKRQAKQNPRGLVPRDSVPRQTRLRRREEVTPRTRLRQRNPQPKVIGKSELSKSIKDILRR